MRGLGFFEALADIDEAHPGWLELTAGLLVVRLIALLLYRAVRDDDAIASARQKVARVCDLPLRRQLRALIDAVAAPEGDSLGGHLTRLLLAYGIDLHTRGHFGPAVDVFTLLCDTTPDADLRMQAMLRRGFALRHLGRFDDAEVTYAQLVSLAKSEGSQPMEMAGRLGLARVAIGRGDYPAAERVVRAVVRGARRLGDRALLANALTDLSGIVGVRGCPLEVLRYANEALPLIKWGEVRSRALINIATALRELGRAGMAEHVARQILASRAAADQHAVARLILYQLAIDAAEAHAAAAERAALEHATLAPALKAEFWECQAREHATFGRFADAEGAVHRMIQLAETHGLNELVIRGDRALRDLSRGIVPAMYEYRPARPARGDAERSVLRIEHALLAQRSA